DSWDLRGGQLFKYLMKGTDDELMQGAISGLADMPVPAAAQALLSGYAHYSPENRKFALDALVRDESRVAVLLDAVESGRVGAEHLGDCAQKLAAQQNEQLRERAKKLLAK
ncbi:MAG: HEAT repeat domain-containing protein, partial [Planctomycetaceae bacterium]